MPVMLLEQRSKELSLIAQFLECLAHFMAMFGIKPLQLAPEFGTLSPCFTQDPAGMLGNGLVKLVASFGRDMPSATC